jgi:hypothetical protein
MTTALILNIVFSAAVFAGVFARLVWSIATQHRDRAHVFVSDPRRARPRAARPQVARTYRGQPWPAA